MISLLLDSSNKNLSVGIGKNGKVLAFSEYEAWQQQSELMIPEIAKLVNDNGITFEQINNIVVAIGPGSYTGVRIAVTIAKIMAFILKAKLYTVSSLAVLASATKPTICLVNARSNRSYFAVYEKDTVLIKDTILPNEEILDFIKANPEYLVSGDINYLGLNAITIDRFQNMLNLINKENEVNDLMSVKPHYLKD